MDATSLNQGNPWKYSAPAVDLNNMFSQGKKGLTGVAYPGGPNFGPSQTLAGRNLAMQNALAGMQTQGNAMRYNSGLAGQQQQWDASMNPTMFDYLGMGVSGLNFGREVAGRNAARDRAMGNWMQMNDPSGIMGGY